MRTSPADYHCLPPGCSTKTAGSQRGFTLLELLVVVSIIALAIGMVAPNLGLTEGRTFNAEVRKAVVALSYARRMAIVQSAPAVAEFRSSDREVAGDYRLPPERHVLWHNEDIELAYQDEFSSDPEAVDQLALTFFPQGGSTGGRVFFSQNQRRAQVRVDAITGRIAVAYNGEELDEAF